MLTFFDTLHYRARRWPPFQRLAIISRILLALALIPRISEVQVSLFPGVGIVTGLADWAFT